MPAMQSKILRVLLKTLLGLLVLVFLLVMAVTIYFKERVPWGVYLAGTPLGGKSYPEVELFLEELQARLKKEQVNVYITSEQDPLVFSLADLGLSLAQDRLLQEIKNIRYSFNGKEMYGFFAHGVHLPQKFNFEDEKWKQALGSLQAERYIPPLEATIYAEQGKLKMSPSRKGQRLNIEKAGKEVLEKLSHQPSFPLNVYLEREWLFPKKTSMHILKMGIRGEAASASTSFNAADQNRNYNIALAAAKLDNVILAPGELFSFNRLVGEANLEAGFKEAPIIVQGRVVPGPGGGICQVSSTLYHAALLAGVSIEERHNHGLPVGYLPPGYDATIAYDYLDLKFRNNKSCHLLIHLQVFENAVQATIFGSPSPAEKIEVVTLGLQKIEPPVKYEQRADQPVSYQKVVQGGKPGFTVETVRIFYEDGREKKRESLGKDYYAPTPQIIAVGTLPAKVVEKKNEEEKNAAPEPAPEPAEDPGQGPAEGPGHYPAEDPTHDQAGDPAEDPA
jgi:vancomycin resistance protein YoaR